MNELNLLITSGNGPTECRIAVAAFLDILCKDAKAKGCDVEVTSGSQPDSFGPKSAVVTLFGPSAHAMAEEYCGTIRFIFKSPIRKGHPRQNWFVGVQRIELEDAQDASTTLDIKDLRFETLRAGGPGGQHQNTTDSAVRATHVPTGIATVCRDDRSQHRNKVRAVERLQSILEALTTKRVEQNKAAQFMANKELERGNATKTFKL
jgi:peptide chain release factor